MISSDFFSHLTCLKLCIYIIIVPVCYDIDITNARKKKLSTNTGALNYERQEIFHCPYD